MDIILSAKGISKTYTAGQVKINALNQCDIEVRKGEFTAIVGKSGSGKSTLLRILGTIDKPDEGKVYIEGKEIDNLKNSELAKFRRTHIGFIYQDYKLIPVLVDNSLPTETFDGATIEIVAPVLKEGNYKWKGLYEGEAISFSMTDAEFKNAVLLEQVAFQHGSCINCVLQIHRKFNEIGEIEITGYSVVTVLDKTDGGKTHETPQGKKHRAYKKFVQDQRGLF